MESTSYDSDTSPAVEGELSIHGQSSGSANKYRTLDESVRETILRDVKAVAVKFQHVLYPKQKKALLQDWDLWGPLFLCVFLALILQRSDSDDYDHNEGGLQFAQIFLIVWMGAAIVTLNSKLLGGQISFFQSACVLGYCLLAPSIALLLNLMIPLLFSNGLTVFIIKCTFSIAGFAWATVAAMVFLGDSQPPKRKVLSIYPIFLFYFIISWLIISRSS